MRDLMDYLAERGGVQSVAAIPPVDGCRAFAVSMSASDPDLCEFEGCYEVIEEMVRFEHLWSCEISPAMPRPALVLTVREREAGTFDKGLAAVKGLER